MRATQWFKPYLTKLGFLVSCRAQSDATQARSSKASYLSLSLLLLSGGLSNSSETSLLLLLGLGAVLVEKLEQLGSSVLVESVGELSDSRRDLEALVKDDLLALETNVLRPLDETCQVGLGLDILTYTT